MARGLPSTRITISSISTGWLIGSKTCVRCSFVVLCGWCCAAKAGVFMSVSAGNDGPSQSTVQGGASSPWVTAVAASTLPRKFTASLTLGNGVTLPLASMSATPSGPRPLLYAGGAAAAGASTDDASLCINGTLDPAIVAGKIVVSALAVLVSSGGWLAGLEAPRSSTQRLPEFPLRFAYGCNMNACTYSLVKRKWFHQLATEPWSCS